MQPGGACDVGDDTMPELTEVGTPGRYSMHGAAATARIPLPDAVFACAALALLALTLCISVISCIAVHWMLTRWRLRCEVTRRPWAPHGAKNARCVFSGAHLLEAQRSATLHVCTQHIAWHKRRAQIWRRKMTASALHGASSGQGHPHEVKLIVQASPSRTGARAARLTSTR